MSTASLEGEGGLFHLKGQIILANAVQLNQQIEKRLADSSLPARVTLDCSEIELADSSAISLLLAAHRQISPAGKSLHIIGLREQLVNLVKIYGVEWILATSDLKTASPAG